ncbi:TrbM/KikA/MpfK family conjugal transfer protein [Actinobacillus seminis]|uniref:TrbM/KikA/MpfK family conjugal transfer protein n=1 Tax=Actinobacillus seminis TaxID=722 RepID=UPI001EEE419F|nr:TrbM/KikA/MpfK family conjugal transfer protein [Actinobacillus seminis]
MSSLKTICNLDRRTPSNICLALCSISQISYAVDELTGDTKTACEVLLCLSSPKDAAKTPECHPPLKKFYSIKAKKWKDTLKKRKNFLKLCPDSNDSSINNALSVKCETKKHLFRRSTCDLNNLK